MLLWLVNFKAGNYPDKMTSDMFMQWVEKKILVLLKSYILQQRWCWWQTMPSPSQVADWMFGIAN
jgi:hypothetical protein